MGYMLGVSTMYILVPDLFLYGFFLGDPTTNGQEIRGIAVVLLRYVAAYNLFDALNLVFLNAIKGAGDTRFVFVTSLLMAAVLAVGTWVAMEYLGAGLHGCWGLVTAWVWILGVVYLLRFLRGPGVRCGSLKPHRRRCGFDRGSSLLATNFRGRYRIGFWEIVG